jgi:hypothetical protein
MSEPYNNLKILFLDFDGVIYTWRADFFRRRSWRAKLHDFLMYKLIYKLPRSWKWRKHLTSRHHDDQIDHYALSWLIQLLEDVPDLHIVVSSVWRASGLLYLKRLLNRHGIDSHRVMSCTPSGDGYRGRDIKMWLEGKEKNPFIPIDSTNRLEWNDQNPKNTGHCFTAFMAKDENGNVREDSFVIVDDDSDMEPYMHRLVQTNGHDGFGHEHYVKIRKLFGVGLPK